MKGGGSMETKQLMDIIQFTIGKNGTRLKKLGKDIYTQEDFDDDLHSRNDVPEKTGCIINLIKTKAAPLSRQTVEKCITSNFLECVFDPDILDPWFFCYQFNDGKELERQINMFHQGITLSVKKLSIKTIGEVKIRLPALDQQRRIGQLYKKAIIQKDLMMKQVENVSTLTMEIIRKIEEEY